MPVLPRTGTFVPFLTLSPTPIQHQMTEKERKLNTSLLMLVPPGILATGWALYHFPIEELGPGLLLLSVVTVFFGAYLRIQIARTNLHLTVSDALIFLSLLVYGGPVAVLLSMIEAGLSSLKLSPANKSRTFTSWPTILTNILTSGFSTFATAFLIETVFGRPQQVLADGGGTTLVYLLAVMAVTQFTCNTFLASAYAAIKSGRRLLAVWNESSFNALAMFSSEAVMAGLAAKALERIDMVQFALAAGFFGLIFLAFKRYADDVRRTADDLEETKTARAEDAETHIAELSRLVEQLKSTADELSESREQFRHAAYHDAITALPNRNYILSLIDQLLKENELSSGEKFAVLLINLNRFRTVNESLGYQTGDRVIKHLAKRLRELSSLGETVGHFGADKFVMVLPSVTSEATAIGRAEAVADCISEAIVFKGRTLYTSASIGLVFHNPNHLKGEEVLRDADIAMYHAKDNRRSWSVFDRSMRARAVTRQQMETDLRYAIVCNEFQVFYQPIVNLSTMKLHGFEALLRWQHPRKGMIQPGQFIPLSEDTGLIIPMTLQALRNACGQAVEWQRAYPDQKYLTMSVNLSGKHFADPLLVEQVENILKETAIDPQCVKLEITESSTMEDAENAIGKLNELKKSGLRLSIDDFGTGYSSLSYLQRLPVDTLKIDRSFVSAMDESGENDEIVRTIMALAHALKLDVIAEGVENVQQLAILRRLGCQFGQGYLFAPPLPLDAVEKMFREGTNWADLAGDVLLPHDTESRELSSFKFAN